MSISGAIVPRTLGTMDNLRKMIQHNVKASNAFTVKDRFEKFVYFPVRTIVVFFIINLWIVKVNTECVLLSILVIMLSII